VDLPRRKINRVPPQRPRRRRLPAGVAEQSRAVSTDTQSRGASVFKQKALEQITARI